MSLIQQQRQSLISIKNALPALKSSHTCMVKSFSNRRTLSYQTGIKVNTTQLNYSQLKCKESLDFNNAQWKYQQQRLYSTPSEKKCWKCNADNKIEDVFCEKCQTIQALSPDVDYYSIFGIKKSFDIDLKSLKAKFLKLQQSVHPDNFSTKSDNEKLYSEQQSSYINKAYHTLLEPLDRAQYLLKLYGHAIEEGEHLSDVEFLMEIMTINEFIETAESQEDIDDIAVENNARMELAIKNLSIFFQIEHWEAAQSETIKLRYWKTIQRTLKEWQPPKNKEK